MLRSIYDTFGYPVEALDGTLGKVKDSLFDDRHWRLRYVVVDTGRWLPGEKVLVSPQHAKQPQTGWQGKHFPVELTKEQVKGAPKLDENSPVSRQYEQEYARYYQQSQPYWSGPYTWGFSQEPIFAPPSDSVAHPSKVERSQHRENLDNIGESHLRSAREIIGYDIHATDESFGHVEDFIIDDEKWKIQYLVIDTRNWLPGRKCLIDIGWLESVDYEANEARVDLSRKQIEHAPEYDPQAPINRDFEKNLYDYYGRPYHWERDDTLLTTPM
ncbi:PRC-barrel domain-containing protein [Pelagicoccus sp. SDUM812002]|uniref:PRC-barrel domain-containing protein n=1 Tax=Pelagicoccus sp. SDUM812002 TaxID=3041266 RepID=UPI00280CB685|nr:PRC-barrel domain-containing protein [Pelagicoccus sp. SDUM812002]MDQ8184809.1 PRC-barrel domain-containing protein [Pelagicoccus sp. SDUM812002]